LIYDQWAWVATDHLRVKYTVTEGNGYGMSATWKNMPAFFVNPQLNALFYVSGYAPYALADGTDARLYVTEPAVPGGNGPAYRWDGKWISSCNADQSRCITVAPHDNSGITHAHITRNYANYQMTLQGYTDILPYASKTARVYVFPFRYDKNLGNGVTVAAKIASLQSQKAW
jgi:hypothetical protein